MDWLWMLSAPAWQKLYFVGIAAGVSLSLYLLLDMLKGWNTKLRKCIVFVRSELKKEKERRKQWILSHFRQ